MHTSHLDSGMSGVVTPSFFTAQSLKEKSEKYEKFLPVEIGTPPRSGFCKTFLNQVTLSCEPPVRVSHFRCGSNCDGNKGSLRLKTIARVIDTLHNSNSLLCQCHWGVSCRSWSTDRLMLMYNTFRLFWNVSETVMWLHMWCGDYTKLKWLWPWWRYWSWWYRWCVLQNFPSSVPSLLLYGL